MNNGTSAYTHGSGPMRASNPWKLAILLVSLLACDVSNGQPLGAGPGRPIEGSTGGLSNQSQSSAQSDLNPGVRAHLDPYGKRCVKVAASSHQKTDFRKIFGAGQTSSGNNSEQGVNSTKLFEHIISAENHCGQTIKLRVCYYGSQNCIPLDVPGYGHQQASLGVAPGMPGFRYQYIEQF